MAVACLVLQSINQPPWLSSHLATLRVVYFTPRLHEVSRNEHLQALLQDAAGEFLLLYDLSLDIRIVYAAMVHPWIQCQAVSGLSPYCHIVPAPLSVDFYSY